MAHAVGPAMGAAAFSPRIEGGAFHLQPLGEFILCGANHSAQVTDLPASSAGLLRISVASKLATASWTASDTVTVPHFEQPLPPSS